MEIERLRVLFLIDGLGYGGAERQLSLLLKYLPPKWERRVASLGGGPYYQVLTDQKTPVVVFQRRHRFDLVPVQRLYLELVRYKPDIVHSWGGLSSALAAPACKALRVIFIDGSIRIGGASSRYHRRTKITFSLADLVVANSHAGLSAYQIPPEKGRVVYNALDPDRLALLRQEANMRKDVTTVIMTGRISPFKDFTTFFQAARRLNTQDPGHWKFIAVGAGNESERMDFRTRALDLVTAGVVDLPNAGLEVLPYLREANVGVLLSALCFKEGISNSIMEYMAAGLPVICSDSGGNRELVVDGETGFVIPSEDVDAFVDKLLFVREHSDVSHAMGRAGHERVTHLCSIDRMIDEYEEIYTSLLSKSRKRGARLEFKKTDRSGVA